jgi:hypothetical protein
MRSFPALVAALIRTSHGVYPDPLFKEKLNRLKYIVRGLWDSKNTTCLLELFANPSLEQLSRNHPRLVAKLQWPFISCRFTNEEKVAALRSHYEFFTSSLPSPIREAISRGESWPLVTVPLDDSECIGLVLRLANFEKEGELAVSLLSLTTQETLFTATFTLVKSTPLEREIFIGGLQGHEFSDDKSRIITITRAMKGLRPKALLLFAIQQIAMAWNCTSLRAVGNSLHIYSSSRKRKDLAADYDAFWSDSGGVQAEDGFFTLPVIPPVRDIAEIKPNKRSTYRQRYALLDKLGEQIRSSMNGQQLAPPELAPREAQAFQ